MDGMETYRSWMGWKPIDHDQFSVKTKRKTCSNIRDENLIEARIFMFEDWREGFCRLKQRTF